MDKYHVVVLNSGSSSIKFSIYELSASLSKLLHGSVENIRESPVLKLFDKNNILVEAWIIANHCYHLIKNKEL